MNITKLFFLILFLGSLNVYAQWNPNGATSGNIYYNGGNVGIGTSSPQAALHVKGQLMIPEATDVSGASPGFIGYVGSEFLHDGVYLNNYGFGYHRYDDGFGWNGLNAYVSGYYGIDFFTGATSRIRINRNGNVGVGVNPEAKLDVNGTVHAKTHFHLGDNFDAVGGRGLVVDNGGSTSWQLMTLKNNLGTQLSLLGNGNLGLGTATPAVKFVVAGLASGGIGAKVANTNTAGTSWIALSENGTDGSTPFYILRYGTTHTSLSKTVDIWNCQDGAIRFGTNNAARMIIDKSGNIGIGSTSSRARLFVASTTAYNTSPVAVGQDHFLMYAPDPGAGAYFGGITWESGGRRRASIAATREHADSDFVGIAFMTKGTDGDGPIYESMRLTRDGRLGIGTSTPDQALTVKGKIHSEEVIVDLSVPGPDYVFEPNYNLAPLDSIETYIKANKHLPEVPSAKEMEANGISLSEMNMILLKKVEELTLYVMKRETKTISRMRSSRNSVM